MLKPKTLPELKYHYRHYQEILPQVSNKAKNLVEKHLLKLFREIKLALLKEKETENKEVVTEA